MVGVIVIIHLYKYLVGIPGYSIALPCDAHLVIPAGGTESIGDIIGENVEL